MSDQQDIAGLLKHLRDRDQAHSERISELLNEVTRRVERIDERSTATSDAVLKLNEAVVGTHTEPGLATRVDRIEQVVLLLRWFFGGGLVAAALALALLWKFGESMSKAS